MSHYRKIDVRIWNDAKFQSLNDSGKLGFLLLLTHPNMTALGAMRATPAGLGADLDCGPEAFAEAFREILAKGMAEYDEGARLVALPNFIRYNPPVSPNVVKAWVSALEFLPECNLKTLVVQRAVAFAEGMSKGFREAIPDALRYTLSIEHRDYPSQDREGLSTTGRGKTPKLALIAGREEKP